LYRPWDKIKVETESRVMLGDDPDLVKIRSGQK
jgi:hypothetical protein